MGNYFFIDVLWPTSTRTLEMSFVNGSPISARYNWSRLLRLLVAGCNLHANNVIHCHKVLHWTLWVSRTTAGDDIFPSNFVVPSNFHQTLAHVNQLEFKINSMLNHVSTFSPLFRLCHWTTSEINWVTFWHFQFQSIWRLNLVAEVQTFQQNSQRTPSPRSKPPINNI